MANEIAVEGMTLQIVNSSPTPVEGTITIIGTASIINKSGGKGAYKDQLQIQVSNITSNSAGATLPDTVPKLANINATITKCKEQGVLFLITGDKTGIINATPLIPGSPNTPYPVTFEVRIVDAGQVVLRGQ